MVLNHMSRYHPATLAIQHRLPAGDRATDYDSTFASASIGRIPCPNLAIVSR